jgi:hypothetical protein
VKIENGLTQSHGPPVIGPPSHLDTFDEATQRGALEERANDRAEDE